MINKVQGQGYFRKSKAFGLVCGITLATAFFGGQVSADEVTTTAEPSTELKTTLNPATNLEAAQGENSQGNKDLQNQANSQNGILKEQITSSELDKAVDTAKKEGVEVSNGKEKEFSNLPDANKELERQKQEVEAAIQKARDNEAKIKEAEAKNAEIDAKNKAEAEKIKKENEQAKSATDSANAKAEENAKKENDELKAKYDSEMANYNKLLKEYEASKPSDELKSLANEVNKQASSYEKELKSQGAVISSNKQRVNSVSEANKVKTENDTNVRNAKAQIEEFNRKKREIESKLGTEGYTEELVLQSLKMLSVDNNSNATVTSSATGYRETTKNYILAPEGNSGYADTIRSSRVLEYTNIPKGWTTTVNYTNLKGYEITLPDGSKSPITRIERNVRVRNAGGSGNISFYVLNDPTEGFVAGRKDGNGPSDYMNFLVEDSYYYMKDGKEVKVVATPDRPVALTYSSLNNNRIGKEGAKPEGQGSKLVKIAGSTVTIDQYGFGSSAQYNNEIGVEWDKADSPYRYKGAIIGVFTNGDKFATDFVQWDGIADLQAGARQSYWFSINTDVVSPLLNVPPRVNLKTLEVPNEPEKPIKPVEPTYVKPALQPFTPKTPNVEDPVIVPEKENVSVTVNPVFVKQTPKNEKDVVNTDNVSVNGKLVAKGSTQKWVLKHESMKAGRPETQKITIEDFMADGFELDVEATKKENQQYATFTYGEDGKLTAEYNKSVVDEVNKDKTKDYNLPVLYLVGKPLNDGGTYVNTFKTTFATAKGSYTVTSNTPVIYTPGNDPENPRKTPDGEDPTPNDSLITPSKDVVDEKGNSINGKTVLPNTVLNYEAIQKLSQYQGMEASKEAIGKGFFYIDDPDENSLDTKSLEVKSITASNGDDVKELLQMYHVLSMDTLDEKLQEIVKNSGISPVGEFYMWVAKNPEEFYKAYVQKGLDITYNLSFKIREDFTEGQIKNQTFQIDFGNGYYSNVVVNDLPKLEVHKEVLDKEGGKSINNSEVKLNEELTYRLEGWVIPTNRSYDLFEYKFVDQLQNTHDSYVKDRVVAKVDFKLSDGTEFKEGDDLTEYTELKFNKETGLYERAFKEDFLKKIPRDSEFGADAFIVAKRIQAGEVNNEYTLYVNGNPVKSEIVTTRTPEPPKPETPSPKQLPKTGETNTASMSLLGLGLLGAIGVSTLKKKKEEDFE